MDITLDLTGAESLQNPLVTTWYLITHLYGWVLILIIIIWGLWEGWKQWRRNLFSMKLPYTLLAIDIPKNNEQSPKAVEHIFSHIYGIYKKGNLQQRYIDGYTPHTISFEIVSIEGFIQFLIRTPSQFRDLIEAAVYAQYPDAEITEVQDYIDNVPKPLEYPNEEYDLWGTEFRFSNKNVYPIRTYPEFEHPLTQKFLDPMASFLEILSRMKPSEQLWFQILVSPAPYGWREEGVRIIKKLIGKKEDKKGIDLFYFPGQIAKGLSESITASIIPPSEMDTAKKQTKVREWPSLMQHLSPDERGIVEAIGYKIAKLGFFTKIRMIYIGRKEVFDKTRVNEAIIGAVKQFNTLNLNGFEVHRKARTTVHYLFLNYRKKWRQRRILWGYRYRSMKRGWAKLILNTEELASLWHFPVLEVKAPLVQKTVSKRAVPPMALPVESVFTQTKPGLKEVTAKGGPPSNLPLVE